MTTAPSLRGIAEGGRKIAAGDFAARVSLRSRDEHGEIGEALNAVAQSIGGVIRRIQDSAGRLEGATLSLAEATRLIGESSQAQS